MADETVDTTAALQAEIEKLKGENFKYREERRLLNEELNTLKPLAAEYETLKASQQTAEQKAAEELANLQSQIAETKANHEALQRQHLAQQAAIKHGVSVDLIPSLNVNGLDFSDDTAVSAFFAPFAKPTTTSNKIVNPDKEVVESDLRKMSPQQLNELLAAERERQSKAW